jgi:transcription initiation factor TFIIB
VERLPRKGRPRTRVDEDFQFNKVLELFQELKPAVFEKADTIMADVQKLQGVRNKVQRAASIWLACKSLRVPVLLKEVAQSYSTPPREILRAVEAICDMTHARIGVARPEVYIERAKRMLVLPEHLKDIAISIISKRSGSLNPVSQAAAAVYLASTQAGQIVSQRTISKALGISEVTVRNAVSRLED